MKTLELSFDEKILVKMAVDDAIRFLDKLVNAPGVSEESKLPVVKQIEQLQSVLAKING